jgi:hypothetical protein
VLRRRHGGDGLRHRGSGALWHARASARRTWQRGRDHERRQGEKWEGEDEERGLSRAGVFTQLASLIAIFDDTPSGPALFPPQDTASSKVSMAESSRSSRFPPGPLPVDTD